MVEVNFSYNENETLKRVLAQVYKINFRIIQNYNPNSKDDYNQIIEDMKYIPRILAKLQDAENDYYDNLPTYYY